MLVFIQLRLASKEGSHLRALFCVSVKGVANFLAFRPLHSLLYKLVIDAAKEYCQYCADLQ